MSEHSGAERRSRSTRRGRSEGEAVVSAEELTPDEPRRPASAEWVLSRENYVWHIRAQSAVPLEKESPEITVVPKARAVAAEEKLKSLVAGIPRDIAAAMVAQRGAEIERDLEREGCVAAESRARDLEHERDIEEAEYVELRANWEGVAAERDALRGRLVACEPRGECPVCGGETDHVDTCEVGILSARERALRAALRREAKRRGTLFEDFVEAVLPPDAASPAPQEGRRYMDGGQPGGVCLCGKLDPGIRPEGGCWCAAPQEQNS